MTNPALRKAAILVASLDTPAADALLDGMDPEQAARVRRAVLELDDVDPAEQQRIMSDFLRGPSHRATADEPDVILDPALADKLRAGADAAGAIADRPTAQASTIWTPTSWRGSWSGSIPRRCRSCCPIFRRRGRPRPCGGSRHRCNPRC
jgi:hypothetical protein